MREGFEAFFDVGLEVAGRCGWVGGVGEGVPVEVVVVGHGGAVVESCVGGAAGESFVQGTDGKAFVGCACDVRVEVGAEMGLVCHPGLFVGASGEEAWDAIAGEDFIFGSKEGGDGVLGSMMNARGDLGRGQLEGRWVDGGSFNRIS